MSTHSVETRCKCYHCKSGEVVRDGLTRNGKQRYYCYDCKRCSREAPQPNGYTEKEQAQILKAYEERSSLRGLERVFGVTRKTVSIWLKKSCRTARVE